jgi:hypothetical protein
MESLDGARGTFYDGIFFTEEPVDRQRLSDKLVKVEISRQNSNLQQVKQHLAKQVRKVGGNALVGFRYGQRSHSIIKQVFTFKWDTESWHGQGYVARMGDRHDPGSPSNP